MTQAPETTEQRRYRCTAEHHEKMARLLAQVGKHRDAAAATEAARRCRELLADAPEATR